MLRKMIGIELEFLLLDKDGKVVIPPRNKFNRDGFPLLGEIRADPGRDTTEVMTNLFKARMETEERLNKGQSIVFTNIHRVPLKLYKEANKQIDYEEKGRQLGTVKNLYGVDIENFSDQVVKEGKIQGINISCGLHIHFSCEEVAERTISEYNYEPVVLPVQTPMGTDGKGNTNYHSSNVFLYKRYGAAKEEKIVARASQLNKPTIAHIVSELDKKMFARYIPHKDERTKFRQAGFYRMREHGFEYRSLPANDVVLREMKEIVDFSFELLNSL